MTDDRQKDRKRVLFRSHHTGMKENDLLFGGFANRYLDELSDDDLAWFEWLIMNHADIDLYNWIMGKRAMPDALDHPVMHRLIDYKNSL